MSKAGKSAGAPAAAGPSPGKKNQRRSSIVSGNGAAPRPVSRSEAKSGKKGKGGATDSPDPEREEQAAHDARESDPSLAWKVVSMAQMDELFPLSPLEAVSKIAEIMGIEDHETNARSDIKLDYYVTCYWFARELKMSRDQTSALFTLLKALYDALQERTFSLAEAFGQFKASLCDNLWTSSDPSEGEKWDPATARKIVDFVAKGPLQHHRLYQFVATRPPYAPEVAADDNDFVTAPTGLTEDGLDANGEGAIEDGMNPDADAAEAAEPPPPFPASAEEAAQVTSALAGETIDALTADIRNRFKKTESAVSLRLQKVERGIGDPAQ